MNQNKIIYILSIIFILLIIIVIGYTTVVVVTRVNCESLGNRRNAIIAYNNGAIWLDGEGDGKPCEHLPE